MRHALSVALFAATLMPGFSFPAPPASKPGAPAAAPAVAASVVVPASATSTAVTVKPPSADQKRMEAILQYRHDLVNVVALRADPSYLLGAAILARPFKHQTPGLDFDALSQRAAATPNAAAEWARLGLCNSKANCPNAKAFAYLKQHAADNAAVWLVAMDVAARDKDEKAEQAALEKAADAEVYDDYFGKALAGVAKALTILPPLADTMQGAHDGQPDNPEGVRMLVAIMSTQAHIRPGFGPVAELCSTDAVHKHSGRKDECLKLAHTLQWGSSPAARAMGLHVQGELESDDKSQTGQANRDLAWQVHEYSGLLQHALTHAPAASAWLEMARNGGTELSLVLATLRAHHIPLDAPADTAAPAQADSSGQ